MRTYTVRQPRGKALPPICITYQGFCKYKGGPKENIAIVNSEGDEAIWELDESGDEGVEPALRELIAYYDNDGCLYNHPIVYRKVRSMAEPKRRFVVARQDIGTIELFQVEASDLSELALIIDPSLREVADDEAGYTPWKALKEYHGSNVAIMEIKDGALNHVDESRNSTKM